jgi:hypothetical protein
MKNDYDCPGFIHILKGFLVLCNYMEAVVKRIWDNWRGSSGLISITVEI